MCHRSSETSRNSDGCDFARWPQPRFGDYPPRCLVKIHAERHIPRLVHVCKRACATTDDNPRQTSVSISSLPTEELSFLPILKLALSADSSTPSKSQHSSASMRKHEHATNEKCPANFTACEASVPRVVARGTVMPWASHHPRPQPVPGTSLR